MTNETLLHWLALHLIPGLGPKRAVPLVQAYRTPERIFHASAAELMGAGLPGSVAHSIASGCTFEEAAGEAEAVRRSGVHVISVLDARYPDRLREIFDPPLLLFARGRVELLEQPAVGVVGTRRPTPYGIAATERLATDLARTGAVIVSGMARGIDTAAHWAALRAGGGTMAVFGSGLDHIYPAENRKLAGEIAAKGLLLSEFAMSTPGHPQNFPIRNRIISGLSAGVLIVEGAQYSGSAITARLAMEQNREVFAVPGNITSKMSWGPNLLIKQGAHLIQDAADVIERLPEPDRRSLGALQASSRAEPSLDEALGPNAQLGLAVLESLRPDEHLHIDGLIEKLDNWSSSEILAVLFELELMGHVRQLPGKNFVKVWGESSRAVSAS